jgi:hypothetical protein
MIESVRDLSCVDDPLQITKVGRELENETMLNITKFEGPVSAVSGPLLKATDVAWKHSID